MRICSAAHTVRSPRLFGKKAAPKETEMRGNEYRKITLPNGIVLHLMRVGTMMVSQAQLNNVLAAIALLPKADVALLAASRVPIHLLPVHGLEDSLLGATTIVQESSGKPWRPTLIRVAVEAYDPRDNTGEIVQHEIGHAIAVIRRQDRSEYAAISYAKAY